MKFCSYNLGWVRGYSALKVSMYMNNIMCITNRTTTRYTNICNTNTILSAQTYTSEVWGYMKFCGFHSPCRDRNSPGLGLIDYSNGSKTNTTYQCLKGSCESQKWPVPKVVPNIYVAGRALTLAIPNSSQGASRIRKGKGCLNRRGSRCISIGEP